MAVNSSASGTIARTMAERICWRLRTVAAHGRVEGGAGRRQRREVGVAGHQRTAGAAHDEIDRVGFIAAQQLLCLLGQVQQHAVRARHQPRRQRGGGVADGLVEGLLGRNPGQQVGQAGAGQVEQQDRPDQPFQQAQADAGHGSCSSM
jgi:hypothetical protein